VSTRIVTFDAGQTLVELDLDFLATRVAERGLHVDPAALRAAAGPAWRRHDALVDEGRIRHGALWRDLFTTLLEGAGASDVAEVVEWLWVEQLQHNVFRAPIPDMVALARELGTEGVRVAVVSNSEGRLRELLEEIGIADAFAAIVDSGRLGIEKPDRRIFDHVLAELGGTAEHAVHVGDSWPTDVAGALAAGWRAIWYRRYAAPVRAAGATDDPRVAIAHDAAGVRAALVELDQRRAT
jgi:HAD superfamily hydrolase (TIGR01549 family)